MVPDQHRHQITETTSPIHQLYTNINDPAANLPEFQKYVTGRDHNFKLSDSTLVPPEAYQNHPQNFYDLNRSFSNSPLHSGNISPYASNSSGGLGSPIHQSLYGQLPNLGLYSGGNSPILNPLLSPNTSPVYGGLQQPSSISSITQGMGFPLISLNHRI